MNNKKRRRKSAFSPNSRESDFQSNTKQDSANANNGLSSNSLTNLLEQYNSDSDDQEETPRENKQCLDDKVNDFFKEIQFITQNTQESQSSDTTGKETGQIPSNRQRIPGSSWQECFDESTGYPYYWHTETNEVTWELPKELESTRKNNDNIVPQQQQQQPNRLPKLPNDKPPSKVKNDNSVRNKSRHKSDTDNTKRTSSKKKKSKQMIDDKNDDSDDSYIEMITSFGDDNTDTDKSEDEKTADESWTLNKSIQRERERERERETSASVASNDARDDDNSRESNQESSVKDSVNDHSSEETLFSKKSTGSTLFPAALSKNWFVDNNSKVDSNVEQTEFSQTCESQDTTEKSEAPKINRPLENLGSSIKGFQRKRRIAFDVLTIPKNNDERLGLGFAKTLPSVSTDNSSKEINAEDRKRNLGKYAIDFIKGETLEVNNEVVKPDNYIPGDQIQTIVDKLKILSKEGSTVSAAQVMSIQIKALMSAWEAGDLKDRYFYNWLADTKKEVSRLEEEAAPSEWDYQWDSANKRYLYRNKINGDTQLNYPDIIGGAEEMELCTTPPPTSSPIEHTQIKSIDSIKDEKYDLTQSKSLNNDDRSNVNSHKDPEKIEKCISSAGTDDKKEDADPQNLAAPLPPRISIPSPPPPPRIGAQDLQKNPNKANKNNNEGQINTTTMHAIKKDHTENVYTKNEVKNNNIVSVESIVAPVRETLLTSAAQILSAPVNTSHIEPLPPGVDQSESPYALAAATLKSPLIFPGNPHQANAPIYASALTDPTNISIIGHHHPALVHNQLVHYPVYHQHLHDQAILAAANRFTGQDAVQLMLHHTGIYANTQVITKPPINMKKESLGSIVDSFYNDIASLESRNNIINDKQIKQVAVPSMKYQESSSSADKSDSVSPNISTTTITTATTPGTGATPTITIAAATTVNTQTTNTNSSGVTATNTVSANAPVDLKDKKKKKVKIVINKKHKQVSSMVAKWKKAQNFQDIH
ncbi:formin-binding protein 4-like isoform X2 [Microplitis mediator]|uniref:formin-binding protein 4-like isoform X2 n=1 Tax=Microplitis mediator TaxID=375433 RepID=UPI0025531B4F|nr:formin-binding protein 4-like isoform X2 [Microplitis mediator]